MSSSESDRFDSLEFDNSLDEIKHKLDKKSNLTMREVIQYMLDNNMKTISIQVEGDKRPDGYHNVTYRRTYFDKIKT